MHIISAENLAWEHLFLPHSSISWKWKKTLTIYILKNVSSSLLLLTMSNLNKKGSVYLPIFHLLQTGYVILQLFLSEHSTTDSEFWERWCHPLSPMTQLLLVLPPVHCSSRTLTQGSRSCEIMWPDQSGLQKGKYTALFFFFNFR